MNVLYKEEDALLLSNIISYLTIKKIINSLHCIITIVQNVIHYKVYDQWYSYTDHAYHTP